MKRVGIISIVLAIILGLTGCSYFEKSNAYYGHGKYRCYYENELTKASFKGVAGDKDKAISQAKEACDEHAKTAGGVCLFSDCIFK